MSYRVRRIDPYWWAHPAVPILFVGGTLLGAAGLRTQNSLLTGLGGVLVALSVLAGTKPVVTLVLACMGTIGGIIQFAVLPNVQTVGWSLSMKVGAGLLFGLMYMIIMDAVVLVAAIVYNFFGAVTGGLSIDIEEAEPEG